MPSKDQDVAIGEMAQRVRLATGAAFELREVRRSDRNVLGLEANDRVGRCCDIIRGGLRKSFQQNGEDLLPVNHGRYLTMSSPHMPAA